MIRRFTVDTCQTTQLLEVQFGMKHPLDYRLHGQTGNHTFVGQLHIFYHVGSSDDPWLISSVLIFILS